MFHVKNSNPFKANPIIDAFNLKNIFKTPNLSRFKRYIPNVSFEFENRKYIVKIVENGQELKQILRLRYNVFYKEYIHKKKSSSMDLDKFDFICDHLAIKDKETNEFVGTYRLNSSIFSNSFYSSSEFNIQNILNLYGNKLELGRSCVKKENRSGAVLAMLWKGIRNYIEVTNTKYLFGCTSLHINDYEPEDIANAFLSLKKEYYSDNSTRVYPKPKFKIKNFDKHMKFVLSIGKDKFIPSDKIVPSLLKFYLKAGSVICGEPAYDKKFSCIDFFTLLDCTKITKRIDRKFRVC